MHRWRTDAEHLQPDDSTPPAKRVGSGRCPYAQRLRVTRIIAPPTSEEVGHRTSTGSKLPVAPIKITSRMIALVRYKDDPVITQGRYAFSYFLLRAGEKGGEGREVGEVDCVIHAG